MWTPINLKSKVDVDSIHRPKKQNELDTLLATLGQQNMERKPRIGGSKSFSILWISCQNMSPPLPPPTVGAPSLCLLVLAKSASLFNTASGTSEPPELLPGVSGKPGDRHVPKGRAAQGGGVGTGFIHRTWFQIISSLRECLL